MVEKAGVLHCTAHMSGYCLSLLMCSISLLNYYSVAMRMSEYHGRIFAQGQIVGRMHLLMMLMEISSSMMKTLFFA